MNRTIFFLPVGLGLTLGACQSKEEKTQQAIVAAVATSPARQVKSAAWKAATTLPPPLPASVDLRRGVEQMLPAEGYVRLVSLTPAKAQPAILTLPVLWRPAKAGAPAVAPGYRIPFEAVVQWLPTGYEPGERIPDSIILYEPAPQDSLGSFSVAIPNAPGVAGAIEQRAKQTILRVKEHVTIRGVLYAYAAASTSQRGLVVYPYRNPTGLPDAKTMVQIPFN